MKLMRVYEMPMKIKKKTTTCKMTITNDLKEN